MKPVNSLISWSNENEMGHVAIHENCELRAFEPDLGSTRLLGRLIIDDDDKNVHFLKN